MILELPVGFSVGKTEMFGEEVGIISGRECSNDIEVNAEVRKDGSVREWGVGSRMVGVVGVEMGGERYVGG